MIRPDGQATAVLDRREHRPPGATHVLKAALTRQTVEIVGSVTSVGRRYDPPMVSSATPPPTPGARARSRRDRHPRGTDLLAARAAASISADRRRDAEPRAVDQPRRQPPRVEHRGCARSAPFISRGAVCITRVVSQRSERRPIDVRSKTRERRGRIPRCTGQLLKATPPRQLTGGASRTQLALSAQQACEVRAQRCEGRSRAAQIDLAEARPREERSRRRDEPDRRVDDQLEDRDRPRAAAQSGGAAGILRATADARRGAPRRFPVVFPALAQVHAAGL